MAELEQSIDIGAPPERTVVEHDEPRGEDATRMDHATSFELSGGPLGGIVGKAAAPGQADAREALERLTGLAERDGGG